MLSSRLFWRVFATYSIFSVVSALAFVDILSSWQREIVLKSFERRLHDSAVMLTNHFDRFVEQGPSVELQAEMRELGNQTETRITLVDPDGVVLADSQNEPAAMENHSRREEIVRAKRADAGIFRRKSATSGVSMMYVAKRVGTKDAPAGFVRIAVPMYLVDEQIETVERIVWGVSTAIVAVALTLTYVLVRHIVVPLQTLTHAAQQIRAGNLNESVEIPNRDELGTLAEIFNLMTRELSDRIEQLQRKRLELEENSELLETVLGSMIEGVVVVDDRQHVLYANAAARRMLDFATRSVTDRPLWEAARHPAIQDLVGRTLLGESAQQVEFELPRTRSRVSVVTTRLPGDPSPGAVLVLHDVTELRRLENLRRDFVSNVSHELKTPLTSIQAYTETLLNGALEDPANNRKFLHCIEEQAERLHMQILDLLSLARIESGQDAFEIRPVSVEGIVEKCIAELVAVADAKDVVLTTESPAEELSVLADDEGLRTILDNLVDNAIKYSPSGSEVHVRWSSEAGFARIEVADNGPGISREHRSRVFERFYRVDKARSRELGGTGLGLSIVKHLSQVFGGSIELLSEVGEGSTFVIRLPLANSQQAQLG